MATSHDLLRCSSFGLVAASCLLVATTMSACSAPTSSDAYVDLSQITEPGSAVLPLAQAMTASPIANLGPRTFTIPALPAGTASSATGPSAKRIRAVLADERQRTYRRILARTHDLYARMAEAMRRKRLVDFEPMQDQIEAEAAGKITEYYKAYAEKRGPLESKLAVLSGFPELTGPKADKRNKLAVGLPGFDGAVARSAAIIRAQIKKLDDDFAAFQRVTASDSLNTTSSRLTEWLADVNRQIADVGQRAEATAAEELARAKKELSPLLAEAAPMPLPAVPAHSVTIPKLSLPSISSAVAPPTGKLGSLESAAARLNADLNLWLRLNRLQLVAKGQGPDRTKEFQTWINAHLPAP